MNLVFYSFLLYLLDGEHLVRVIMPKCYSHITIATSSYFFPDIINSGNVLMWNLIIQCAFGQYVSNIDYISVRLSVLWSISCWAWGSLAFKLLFAFILWLIYFFHFQLFLLTLVHLVTLIKVLWLPLIYWLRIVVILEVVNRLLSFASTHCLSHLSLFLVKNDF